MDTKSSSARDSKKFDWQGLEAAAITQVVAAVRRVRAEYPDEHIYGAMFCGFYGDGTVICWPSVSVGTEETLARLLKADRKKVDADLEHSLRWSGPDLETVPGGAGARLSEAGDSENAWAERCQATASASGGFEAWGKIYDRFLHVFPRAAKKARAQLVDEGVVGKEFIAIAADEGGDLIPLSLTKAQISRHFPEYDAQAQERARLAALPLAERVAELVPQAVYDYDDPAVEQGVLGDEYEALVRELGEAAIPALIDVVIGRARGGIWKACMLLAEINLSTPEVIAALEQVMTNPKADEPTRCWAASALARLDRMDLIVQHAAQLPVDIVATGLAAPYTSFRDKGKHSSLNYAPLEAILREHPEFTDAVAKELKPGSGFCEIDASEVAAARAGLESPWPFIQKHAQLILEWWEER